MIETDIQVINMGPQHPSTHGVLRLLIKTDGEIVTQIEPIIGYLHRCAEKIGESVNYKQNIAYTDRLDYLAAMGNNLGLSLAIEELMGIEVPRYAQIARVIIAELQRIASHQVAIGTYGLDLGTFTPFLFCFRDREKILDIFEKISGARLTYNFIRPGGLARALPDDFEQLVEEFINYYEKQIPELDALLTYNKIFINRTANIGILDKETAIAYGCSGPVLRGSGVEYDLRKNKPYCIYNEIEFDVAVGRGEKGTIGDCWDRYWVRIEEMRQSIKIIRQALKLLKQEEKQNINKEIPQYFDSNYIFNGEHLAKLPRNIKPSKGFIYKAIENPRGELGFFIFSDGSLKPYRLKIRAPSFCNLSVLEVIGKNAMIADLVAIVGSIDIVLGEVDR